MITEIGKFLESQSPKEIIVSFDTDYDIPFRHNHAIGLLYMLGAFECPKYNEFSTPALAVYVGASWCRLVSEDVRYRLLDGIEVIEASQKHADWLEEDVLVRCAESACPIENDDLIFSAYAVARWLDGAGKIKYRAGNHTEGRMLFDRAVKVCRTANLWWCEPDLISNFLRAKFEELRIVKDKTVVFEEIKRSIALAERQCQLWNLPMPAREGEANSYHDLEVRKREFLRGFSSLLHNFSVTAAKDDPNAAVNASTLSEAICLANGDDYRFAQAKLFQAQNKQQQGDAAAAIELFKKITEGQWRRGRLIARQNLARIEGAENIEQRINHLKAIFDEISADNSGRGGQVGLDLDFHAYTVGALGAIVQNTKAINSVPQPVRDNWFRLFDEQRTLMIQSLRRVVLIASYKQKFSKWVYPIFLERIQRAMNATELEHGFSLVEESSTRELLDLMGTAAQQGSLPAATSKFTTFESRPFTESTGNEKDRQTGNDGRRGGLRELSKDKIYEIKTVLEQSRKEFEAAFMNRQIASVPHDPDLAHRTRMFVANDQGTCLIRYFSYGVDKSGQPTRVGVYVFRGRNMNIVSDLDFSEVKRVCEACLKKACPSPEDCLALWVTLIDPIRHLIVKQLSPDAPETWPNNLVIIPSDVLFQAPLHVALDPRSRMPLAAIVPLCFSVSASAHISRGRHLYRCQAVDDDDDLCAMIVRDKDIDAETGLEFDRISGAEIESVSWPQSNFHLAGFKPNGVVGKPNIVGESANHNTFQKLMEVQPEFFVFSGHGYYASEFNDFGAALGLEDREYLTQFDLLMRVRLRHNKLTLLNACVAGQGADAGAGEVAGFVRALIGAGAGAIGITLWNVLDTEIGATARHLLHKALLAQKTQGLFDCVDSLFHYYKQRCSTLATEEERIESCTLALYL